MRPCWTSRRASQLSPASSMASGSKARMPLQSPRYVPITALPTRVGMSEGNAMQPPIRLRPWAGFATLLLVCTLLSGCGYNTLQQQDEQVQSAWSEVLNQYQRRADLVPNLVNTVKGAVASEKDILDSVVSARARATSIQASPELIND